MTEAHLQRACKDACALLDTLANTPNEPLRGSLLARCDGLVFEWSFKAGVGLGIQMGEVRRGDPVGGCCNAYRVLPAFLPLPPPLPPPAHDSTRPLLLLV